MVDLKGINFTVSGSGNVEIEGGKDSIVISSITFKLAQAGRPSLVAFTKTAGGEKFLVDDFGRIEPEGKDR